MSQTSGFSFLDQLLGALDRGDQAALFELVVDERLEQLERHLLGQTALVQAQLGTDDDDRTAGVVDALSEQVLTEATLLALEHVGKRLERALVRPGDGLAAPSVVEERVDRLLQHPLLVADDDLRRVELLKALEAVVPVDHAPVQIVEVDVAKRPPSSGTRGRRSGGMTGMTSSIIHSGRLPESRNASTTFSRLAIFLRFASEVVSFISIAQLLGQGGCRSPEQYRESPRRPCPP
jgi:hypothetical protein